MISSDLMFLLQVLASLLNFVDATKYKQYILAPKQRNLKPIAVHSINGDVRNANTLLSHGQKRSATTFGANSSLTLDFGRNVAGTVQFNVRHSSGPNEFVGVSFTESSMWISPFHCDSASVGQYDSPLWFKISQPGEYKADKYHQRGGFRYMSLWHNSTGTISLENLVVYFTASPEVKDLQGYRGYFHSDSEKLNRVWYAGAYTNQLCIADPTTGNTLGIPGTNWYYNATISNGTSVLMDGAKRDRLVWPGDVIISAPSIFVSTNSLDGIRNAIDSLFLLQQSDGRLPWAGVPFTRPNRFPFSFTYHLYTLLDLHLYYLYTGDVAYLKRYWSQYMVALSWSLATVDESRLANITSTNDWLRSGMGGHNVEANAILYYTLSKSLELAQVLHDHAQDAAWMIAMQGIKSAINQRLWNPAQSLFFDNDTVQTDSSIHPQDGNSWVIIAGLVDPERAGAISASLQKRWVKPYGAPAPEAGSTISPFATGFEVQAHFLAGHPERAVELIEFMWADFMLDDPRMTNSSFIEGYATDGSLKYAPYANNDARISHAHGWATGPTASLTFYAAGLQILSGQGKTWTVQPRLGLLREVEGGFETALGGYAASWTASRGAVSGWFRTPDKTSGSLVLPYPKSRQHVVVKGPNGISRPEKSNEGLVYRHLHGGTYHIYVGRE